jgi:hypothetical protein
MSAAARQPKGQSTGGQFAASQNPESTVDLDEPVGPYDGYEGWTVDDLRQHLETLPGNEPILPWLRTRSGAAEDNERDISPTQWMNIHNEFTEKTDNDHGPWSALYETFIECVDEVVPEDDFATPRSLLESLRDIPDDEPLMEFIATRAHAEHIADRPLSDEEWRAVVREFDAKSNDKYNAAESMMMAETIALSFLEGPDEVAEEVDNPYYGRGLRSAAGVRNHLSIIPDDEPVVNWLMTRADAEVNEGKTITPSQWAQAVENFTQHDDEQALLFMEETFSDVVSDVTDRSKEQA